METMTDKKQNPEASGEVKKAPPKKRPAAKKKAETTFQMAEMMQYSEELFGVGGHVLVGARTGGFLGPDPVTRSQCQKAIEAYLASPVEGS